MPRLYREAPLNSIWEGSGNVICLDVLRALGKEANAVDAMLAELRAARGADPRFDAHCDQTEALLARAEESQARRITEALALALQGALLVRHAPAWVADAFCASRLANEWGHTLGTLPTATDIPALVKRAQPTGA